MHSKVLSTPFNSRQFSARVTGRRKLASLRVSLQRRQALCSKRVPAGPDPAQLRSSTFDRLSHQAVLRTIACNAHQAPMHVCGEIENEFMDER
jgi:hypothetical protein